jgi:hypothetical protein
VTAYTGIVRPLFYFRPQAPATGVQNLGSFFLFALEGSAGGGVGTTKVFMEVETTTTASVMEAVRNYDYVTLTVTGTQTGLFINIGAVTDAGSYHYTANVHDSD